MKTIKNLPQYERASCGMNKIYQYKGEDDKTEYARGELDTRHLLLSDVESLFKDRIMQLLEEEKRFPEARHTIMTEVINLSKLLWGKETFGTLFVFDDMIYKINSLLKED